MPSKSDDTLNEPDCSIRFETISILKFMGTGSMRLCSSELTLGMIVLVPNISWNFFGRGFMFDCKP